MASTPTGRPRFGAPQSPRPTRARGPARVPSWDDVFEAPPPSATRRPASGAPANPQPGPRNVAQLASDDEEAWSVFEGGRPRSVATPDPRRAKPQPPTQRPTDRSTSFAQGAGGTGSAAGTGGGRGGGQGAA
jgi:hypothetical protein